MLRARVKLVYDQCYKGYMSRIEENLNINIRAFWKYAKSTKATNDLPRQMRDSYSADNGTDITNLFASYFSSVYNEPTTSAYAPDFHEPLIFPI